MRDVIRIGVAGALGRMGAAIEALARERSDMVLAARWDRPGAIDEAQVAPPLASPKDALAVCDVILDFSTAEAGAGLAALAAARGGPALVIGATGFDVAQDAAVAAAAARVAIVKSGNFSMGVNLLAALVEAAARRLDEADWDVEILEVHHRRKRDAPSGTALMLGEAAARGRGGVLAPLALPPRFGVGEPRPTGGIGFAAVRGGGVVGEHSVLFAAEDETITLSHSAKDRRLFARGALEAAAWVNRAKPGLYDMRDVIGTRLEGVL